MYSSRHFTLVKLQVNMFIVVLLIARVSSEWVEISQNNYRQESPGLKHTEDVDLDTDNFKYHNQSINQWKRGSIDKVPHIGNVKRVPYASVKTPLVKPTPSNMDRPPVVGEGSLTKIRQHSVESNERNSHEVRLKGGDLNDFGVQSNPYISRRINSQVENSVHIDLGSGDRIDGDAKTEEHNKENLSSDKGNPSKHSNVKISKPEKIKNFNKDQSFTDDWKKSSVSDENKMDRVWEAVKLVANTISKQSRRGFKSKVRYLEDLRNTITTSVEAHIDRLWPDDKHSSRFRRGAEARGYVEVPSSEGALMTISFLTFAVFLIKLVLQVIHAYKQKAMMVTPAIVAAVGRASRPFIKKP